MTLSLLLSTLAWGADAPPVDATPVDAPPAATPVDAPPAATPVDAPLADPLPAEPAADGLEVAFGEGVELSSADGHFALTMRARVQLRASAVFRDEIDAFSAGEEPVDLLFQVRRARLLFIGNLPQHDLLLYLQLGLGPSDIDGENPIPLRDWVVAYNRWPSLSFRFGQMKVPYSRERLMSSSALEFADRTVVNAAMNLDRDVGAQVYSNDLLGLGGRLAYQVGVYNGEGRNEVNVGTGLLYAARASLQPFGEFPDTLSQADLVRSAEPRLSLGLAAAANRASLKENGTFGDALTVPHDTDHGAADVLFKWRGLSVHAETLARSARPERAVAEGEPTTPELWGWMTQVGYVTPWFSEVAVRFAEVRPLRAPDDTLYGGPTVTVGHYFREHDLKLQADYGWIAGPALLTEHEARLQLQVYF